MSSELEKNYKSTGCSSAFMFYLFLTSKRGKLRQMLDEEEDVTRLFPLPMLADVLSTRRSGSFFSADRLNRPRWFYQPTTLPSDNILVTPNSKACERHEERRDDTELHVSNSYSRLIFLSLLPHFYFYQNAGHPFVHIFSPPHRADWRSRSICEGRQHSYI